MEKKGETEKAAYTVEEGRKMDEKIEEKEERIIRSSYRPSLALFCVQGRGVGGYVVCCDGATDEPSL